MRVNAFARSVTVVRSSAVQASSSRRQERMWAIVCGSPQSQSTDWASVDTVFAFARRTPVRSRLNARQQSQSSPDPAGKDTATPSPILMEAGTSVRLSFQSRCLLLLPDESSGVTVARMKLFRDFNLLAAGRSAMEQLASGVCRLSCAFHATGNIPPDVRRGDTGVTGQE